MAARGRGSRYGARTMSAGTRTHYRTCHLCEAMCGVEIALEGDRILGIRGDEQDPFSQGHICPKGPALADLHNDPDRIRRPLRRRGSDWEEIDWATALDEAAERIHGIQRRDGNDAVGLYVGNPNAHNLPAMLFAPMLLKGLRTRKPLQRHVGGPAAAHVRQPAHVRASAALSPSPTSIGRIIW